MVEEKISLNMGQYEPSDSEEEYTPRERQLLEKFRKSQQRQDESSEEEVLGLDADEDDSEADVSDDGIDQFRDSDDEEDEDEGLPDVRAWGKSKKDYYQTDFVDQDYSSYTQKEEEAAAQELEEAKSIQQRLAKQLNESDFSLDVLTPSGEAGAEDDDAKLTTDFSKLTVREKQMLFKKDSPEFEGLVDDMHHHLEESQAVLLPFLDYCRQNNVTGLPVIKFAKTLNNLYLNYGNNVAYYLILKAKRIPVKSHPVVKRLVQMRQLIEQLVSRYEKVVKPEIERLLADLKAGKTVEVAPLKTEMVRPKKMLNLMRSFSGGDDEEDADDDDDFLEAQPKTKRMKLDHKPQTEDAEEEYDDEDAPAEEEAEDDENVRRPINYQIAKNKGLTTHKYRAEQRNPRVRNRKRYQTAVKRRKGAVRAPRTEIPKYDGERTGIKAYLKRSINIK